MSQSKHKTVGIDLFSHSYLCVRDFEFLWKCENWKTVYIHFYKVITSYIPTYSELLPNTEDAMDSVLTLLIKGKYIYKLSSTIMKNMPRKTTNDNTL